VEETSSTVSDNFDDLNSDGWDEMGDWEVNDQGQYVSYGDSRRSRERRSYFGDEDLTDYDVTVKATLDPDSWGFGLYFRMQHDENNLYDASGYAFQYNPGLASRNSERGGFIFRKVTHGRESAVLGGVNWRTADENWKWFEQEHELRVSVRGDTFIGYVDGEEVARHTDSNPYTSGGAGLRVWRGTVTFDDFSITTP